jgi:hypothetical protein
MDGVGTPIIGRPRPLRGHRPRATRRYTLNCEEPDYHERMPPSKHTIDRFASQEFLSSEW